MLSLHAGRPLYVPVDVHGIDIGRIQVDDNLGLGRAVNRGSLEMSGFLPRGIARDPEQRPVAPGQAADEMEVALELHQGVLSLKMLRRSRLHIRRIAVGAKNRAHGIAVRDIGPNCRTTFPIHDD